MPVTDTLAQRLREALGPDYSLEQELGGAGMSRVFVATEKGLNRRVVVKVLPPDLAAGVNMERFRREIQLAAALQHPHVVPLLSAGERGDLLWFTMPFIEGESLRAILDRRGTLPAREVLDILHDVVDALAYAHSRGVVHRDIKPGNILMSGTHAMVTDFGVAKALSAAIPLTGHTTSGMAIGTPAYMAPEQLAADPDADHRVDIYAVGLLAYELLVGGSPFSGKSPQATLAAQLTVKPTAPHITRPDIPAALSRVIMHCLEKDADKRPASASALLQALDTVSSQLSGEQAAATHTRKQRGMLITFAVLLIASTVFALSRSREASRLDSASVRDSVAGAVVPETVLVYKEVPVGRDEAEGISLQAMQPVLSPEESLAVVRSFRARDGRIGTSVAVDRDSLVAEISRVFADSMQRAIARMQAALEGLPRQQELQQIITQGGPETAGAGADVARESFRPRPPGGPEGAPDGGPPPAARNAADSARVRIAAEARARGESMVPLIEPPPPGTQRLAILALSNRTRDSSFDAFGLRVLDSVDAALQGSRGRLEIITPTTTSRLLSNSTGSRPNTVAAGFAMRANFVLSGVYFVRNDSLVLLTQLTDVQGGSETRARESIVPLNRSASAIPEAASWVRARLDSMRREDGRRARDQNAGRRQNGGAGTP